MLGGNRSPHKQQKLIFKKLARSWKDIDRQYLYRIVSEFNHERLVDYREQADGSIKIVVTEKGKEKALIFNVDNLEIRTPTRWDQKWRLVMYDIPETKKALREALRAKLKELGFHEWQKSVFVHPYPCQNEIDFLVEFFEARPYVRHGELTNPLNEAELRLAFDLT